MLVYRFEDDAGKGPYGNLLQSWTDGDLAYDWDKHPTPRDDFAEYSEDDGLAPVFKKVKVRNNANAIFGFPSKASISRWFGKKIRKKMYVNGYKLKIYEIDEAYVAVSDSKKQCIFNRKRAKKIGDIKLPTDVPPTEKPIEKVTESGFQLPDMRNKPPVTPGAWFCDIEKTEPIRLSFIDYPTEYYGKI